MSLHGSDLGLTCQVWLAVTACGSWHWDLLSDQACEVSGLETRRDVQKEMSHTDGQTGVGRAGRTDAFITAGVGM